MSLYFVCTTAFNESLFCLYDTEVMKLAQDIIPNPVTIRLRREEESLDNIKQYYIECQSQDDKGKALSNIYGSISIGQTVVF